MKLRCYLFSLLRIHRPDCKHCSARVTSGQDIRKRLEELNTRTPQHSLNDTNYEEIAQVFDPKPSEGVASPSILSTQQKKVS